MVETMTPPPPIPEEVASGTEQPATVVAIEQTDTATIRQLIDRWKQQLGHRDSWDLAGILDYKPFDTAFVARKDREVIGAVTLHENEIVGLYVLPKEREQGYAEALLKHAVDACVERGFERVKIAIADKRVENLINKLVADPVYTDRFETTEAYRD